MLKKKKKVAENLAFFLCLNQITFFSRRLWKMYLDRKTWLKLKLTISNQLFLLPLKWSWLGVIQLFWKSLRFFFFFLFLLNFNPILDQFQRVFFLCKTFNRVLWMKPKLSDEPVLCQHLFKVDLWALPHFFGGIYEKIPKTKQYNRQQRGKIKCIG